MCFLTAKTITIEWQVKQKEKYHRSEEVEDETDENQINQTKRWEGFSHIVVTPLSVLLSATTMATKVNRIDAGGGGGGGVVWKGCMPP